MSTRRRERDRRRQVRGRRLRGCCKRTCAFSMVRTSSCSSTAACTSDGVSLLACTRRAECRPGESVSERGRTSETGHMLVRAGVCGAESYPATMADVGAIVRDLIRDEMGAARGRLARRKSGYVWRQYRYWRVEYEPRAWTGCMPQVRLSGATGNGKQRGQGQGRRWEDERSTGEMVSRRGQAKTQARRRP